MPQSPTQKLVTMKFSLDLLDLIKAGAPPPEIVIALIRTLALATVLLREPKSSILDTKDGLVEAIKLEYDTTIKDPNVEKLREVILSHTGDSNVEISPSLGT